MKSGFSILEVMTVMSISVVLISGIFQVYRMVQKNALKVEQYTEQSMKIVTLQNRMQQDFTGFGAIWFTQNSKHTKDLMAGKKVEAPSQQQNQFFYADQKNKKFNFLTFVTTAGLATFDSAKPHFLRVAYEMQPDNNNQGLFQLVRKEASGLSEFFDEKALAKTQDYVLVDGVKSIDFNYVFIDMQAIKKSAKGEKFDKDIIRSVRSWGPAEDDEEQQDVGGAGSPRAVKVKITLAREGGFEQAYEMSFYIPSSIDVMPKSYEEIRKERKFKGGSYKKKSASGKAPQKKPSAKPQQGT